MKALSQTPETWLIYSLAEEDINAVPEKIRDAVNNHGVKTIEIRADALKQPTDCLLLLETLSHTLDDIGVLVTCMAPEEKPSMYKGKGTLDDRIKLLRECAEKGASVTLEHVYVPKDRILEFKKSGYDIVAALHYWDNSPHPLEVKPLIDEMAEYASIIKVFMRGETEMDVTKWKDVATYLKNIGKPFMTALMGEKYKETRINAIKDYHASGTFCRLGSGTAPDQYTFEEAKKELRII